MVNNAEKERKIDEILEEEGYRKFLVLIRSPKRRPWYQPAEIWAIIVSEQTPRIGQRTTQSIGTFCIEIPEGEIVQVEDYRFLKAQKLGVIPENCLQCRKPLTEESIFGLTDVLGGGGRDFYSEACFRLHQEA